MTLDKFQTEMIRLEGMFRAGKELPTRAEYWRSLRYVEDGIFKRAVDYVISSFKPFPSEPFPALATIESAIIEMKSEVPDEIYERGKYTETVDLSSLDYCQRCDNSGMYLATDGQAHICECEKGRLKRASWKLDPAFSDWQRKRRDEKIQQNLTKIPPSRGAIHGLQEWNPLGFWEPTSEEHEAWCAAKRAQIEDIKRRRAEFADERAAARTEIGVEPLKRVLAETLAQVSERVVPEQGDDDVPF